ncbi:MAG TPA: type III-A CRISPR-associated RAMP protein Csm4 [Methanospirillum sp.]|nr:type III-A CRISPR-associated RAMP protein Csm4 [Methanospirillum sp.]
MQAVYLTPRSTFPEALPSNTLFGAICTAMADLGEDVGAFIETFESNHPLLISSCFPYTGSSAKPVRLYPMPSLPPSGSSDIEFDMLKTLKKIKYVDEAIFNRLSSGSLKMDILLRTFDRFSFNRKKGILCSEKGTTKLKQEEVDIPHNRINRLSSASDEFYHTSGSHYGDGGLYFLIDYKDTSWEKSVTGAIRLLADQGIGKRRSSGQGHFDLAFGTAELEPNQSAPYLTTLSRFLPESMDPFGQEIWYDLISVRGRSSDGMMTSQVLMLGEGSVFKNIGKTRYGKIATVREKPRKVEFGLAFPVGMRCIQ